MESNYYTPSIDEFSMGLEYELASVDCNWTINGWKNITVDTDFNFKFVSNYPGLQRIKFLDKEDIESVLNIPQTKGDEVELNFQLRVDDYLFYEFDYDIDNKIMTVEKFYQTKLVAKPTGVFDCFTLFSGRVKNKSEFKKLLQMLNITE